MNNAIIGLITTFLLGIFILIGALLAFLASKKEKIVEFSIGLAFGVIAALIVIDLIPEIVEEISINKCYIAFIGIILGFGILKILDKFIPDHDDCDHHHHHKLPKKKATANLAHIGIITSFALILHNIIEGMAIYSTVLDNPKLGIAIAFGVGLHNLPLGVVITGTFYQSNQSIKKTLLWVLLVSISTFIGALILFVLNIVTIPGILLGLLLSITLGMLLYISISELIPRIKHSNIYIASAGISLGIIILLVASFFAE